MKFTELSLIPPLLKAIEKQELIDATEIQAKVIPHALK
jgi:superfamily II DNA/RNA helicase